MMIMVMMCLGNGRGMEGKTREKKKTCVGVLCLFWAYVGFFFFFFPILSVFFTFSI